VTNFNDLDESLEWLAKRGWLSGSLGRGESSGKDIDVFLPDRHIQALKKLLNAQEIEWDSPFIGCITWWPGDVQVETSYLFPRYKTGDKRVFDVWFRT